MDDGTHTPPDDRALMLRALEKTGLAEPAPASRKKARPPRPLNEMEELFINAYLRTGSATDAARAAGYASPMQHGSRVLKRPLVQARVQEVLAKVQAERIELNKESLLKFLTRILTENRPFERLKAIELAAKLGGHMAPTRSIMEHRTGGKVSPYVELISTLRSSGTSFTPEERLALRQQLTADLAAIGDVLAVLDGASAAPTH